MDRVVPERQWREHHVIPIVRCGEVAPFREGSLTNCGEEIVGGQRKDKRWGLHTEPCLDVWDGHTIHLHAQARCSVHSGCSGGPQFPDLCEVGR